MSVALAQYAADVRGYGHKAQQMFAEEVLAPVGIGTYAFRSKAISSRSGTLKTLAGKHCQTLIQVKFPRAYLAVEGSARRFGTAGDLVTARRCLRGSTAVRRGGRGRRIGPSLGAGNPAKAANVKATKSTGFKNLEGKGAQAEIEGKTVFLGNKLLMTENKIDLGELGAKSEELQGAGRTVVHLAVDGKLVGLIAIADAVR